MPAAKSTVSDVMEIMEAIAPRRMACEGDPVGLHAGSPKAKVRKILLALDAGFEVIEQAAKMKADLIVTHHPRFFRPLLNVDLSRRDGEIAQKLLKSGIALFCAHTNLDIAPGGVNDVLADLAGMDQQRKPLQTVYRDTVLKLNVFVPHEDLDKVRRAVCEAGAGEMGEYTECCYMVKGVGMFRPSNSARPHIGTSGQLEEVEEWRLETVLPASCKHAVRRALLQAHPYEEPAYDFVTLSRSIDYGLGRVGMMTRPVKLGTLAKKLKRECQSKGCLMMGQKDTMVKRLAVWSGSSAPVSRVLGCGVDVVVCGELGHHDAELLQENGVGAIVLGHWASEYPVLNTLAENLQNALEGVEVTVSDNCCAPLMNI